MHLPSVYSFMFSLRISWLLDPFYVSRFTLCLVSWFCLLCSPVYRLLPDIWITLCLAPTTVNKPPHCNMDSRTASSLQNTSPPSNPAERNQLQSTVECHSQALHSISAQLTSLRDAMQNAVLNHPRCADVTTPLALPERFNGAAERCKGFLQQCRIRFATRPENFPTERSKCAFIFSLLSERALDWATAVWETDTLVQTSATYCRRFAKFLNIRIGVWIYLHNCLKYAKEKDPLQNTPFRFAHSQHRVVGARCRLKQHSKRGSRYSCNGSSRVVMKVIR